MLYGSDPVNASQLKLAIDEDQISDSERGHTTEQVAYVVFAGEASLPPPDAEVTKYYYAAGARVAMQVDDGGGDVVYYLHADHLGSASLATHESGAEVTGSRTLYYPYGEQRWSASGGTLPTDFTYTGQRADSYTQLIHMGARWYDAQIGRWISADTIIPDPANPQSLNRYSYVYNNALKYIDPSGHAPCVDVDCNLVGNPVTGDLIWRGPAQSLPSSRYYYSDVYGYFDRSHLDTGNPSDIIAEVGQRINAGGGEVNVPQRVNKLNGMVWLEYVGIYQISSDTKPEDALGIAFGIYMDWGHRFEEWEGSSVLGLLSNSSFAIEDLPSHYLGFFMAATGLSRAQAFALLGGVEGTKKEPTRDIENHTYNPWVDDKSVPWPALMTSLMPTPIESGANTWEFVGGSCRGFACNVVSVP